jgi:hypothetical protein
VARLRRRKTSGGDRPRIRTESTGAIAIRARRALGGQRSAVRSDFPSLVATVLATAMREDELAG